LRISSILAAAVLATGITANAAVVWNGSISTDATVAGNWTYVDPEVPPPYNDTDYNPGGTGVSVNFATSFDAANLTTNRVVDVGSRNLQLALGSSSAMTVSNFQFIAGGPSGVVYSSRILTWAGNNTITGNMTLGNNTINFGTPANATQRIGEGDKLTITGTLNQTNARNISFLQPGTVEIQGNLNQATAQTVTVNGTGTTIIGGNITTNNRFVTAGTLKLTGAVTNANANSTTVNGVNGALIIDGSHTPGVTVTAGRLGGDGTIGGLVSLAAGAKFIFTPGQTLDVNNTVTLDATFGVDDLVKADGSAIDWSTVAGGTYTLIGATTTDFSHIENFGLANAASLAGGRSAYFKNGSLQLVVAVPEPSTLAALGLSAVVFMRRRRVSHS
jgi:hypothetical protein